MKIGIKLLTKIFDNRGSVCHFLRRDDKFFNKFGEIYFSTVYPGKIKAWHLHKKMELNYCVIKGMIKLVLYDGKEVKELFIGDKNYLLVKVPPGIWNGFTCLGNEEAIVANCATLPYSEEDIVRIDFNSKKIPYKW